MRINCLTGLLLLFFAFPSFSQNDTIYLKNPSFEGIPNTILLPKGWTNCNENTEVSADIHPSGAYGIQKKAVNGDTYISLLADENKIQEKVGQLLVNPLTAGQCYSFKLSLCRTNHYKSATRRSINEADYTKPIKLSIWGGTAACQQEEKLAESQLIENTNWLDFVFTFQPKASYTHLILQATYNAPFSTPYNGHVLIDNASAIIELSCDSLAEWTKDPTLLYSKLENTQNLMLHEGTLMEDPNGIKAIYYNESLTMLEQEAVISQIQLFVKRYPKQKANIIIEEVNKKRGRASKRMLVKALNKLGITSDTYAISIFKG